VACGQPDSWDRSTPFCAAAVPQLQPGEHHVELLLLMAAAMAFAMFTVSSVASNLPKSTPAANPDVLGRAKLGATRFPR